MIRIVTDGYIEKLLAEREEKVRKEEYMWRDINKMHEELLKLKDELRKIRIRVDLLERKW